MSHNPGDISTQGRLLRSCDRCRRLKKKCDGLKASCSRCTKALAECIYRPRARWQPKNDNEPDLPKPSGTRGVESTARQRRKRVEKFKTLQYQVKNLEMRYAQIQSSVQYGSPVHGLTLTATSPPLAAVQQAVSYAAPAASVASEPAPLTIATLSSSPSTSSVSSASITHTPPSLTPGTLAHSNGLPLTNAWLDAASFQSIDGLGLMASNQDDPTLLKDNQYNHMSDFTLMLCPRSIPTSSAEANPYLSLLNHPYLNSNASSL
ncbi:hypothetical protein H4R35_006753 [Dimargaris xerosporica]|nr:hypothetical protein H4R35_006753 [Dimargaris xerosporica]